MRAIECTTGWMFNESPLGGEEQTTFTSPPRADSATIGEGWGGLRFANSCASMCRWFDTTITLAVQCCTATRA